MDELTICPNEMGFWAKQWEGERAAGTKDAKTKQKTRQPLLKKPAFGSLRGIILTSSEQKKEGH
jgi:hypothetical protein